MLLKTSNGNTYTVDWIDTAMSGDLYLQMQDERALSVIAAEFDGLDWLERKSENEGDKWFDGYSALRHIQRAEPGVVIVSISKGGNADGGTN